GLRDRRFRRDLRRPLSRSASRRRDPKAASRPAADAGGARSARALAAPLDLAEGAGDRRLRDRDVRAWLHLGGSRVRPLAQGLAPKAGVRPLRGQARRNEPDRPARSYRIHSEVPLVSMRGGPMNGVSTPERTGTNVQG